MVTRIRDEMTGEFGHFNTPSIDGPPVRCYDSIGRFVGLWGVWRIMKMQKSAGFTLIELLAVIAIIAILAGLIGVAAPRALEKARITDVENDFNQIRTALTSYAADFGGYPPRYGYRRLSNEQLAELGVDPYASPYDASIPDSDYFFLDNYMERIGLFKSFDLYDRFNNDTHDANLNDTIQFLEYDPVGRPDPVNPSQYSGFSNERFVGGNNSDEVTRMLREQGPYIYIPVYSNNAKRFWQYCMAGYDVTGNLDYAYGRILDFADPTTQPGKSDTIAERYLSSLQFPPPKYDAFVLISVGPTQNVNGLLPTPLTGQHPSDILDAYHILGLRAYFLATRDINRNNQLDFDFRARTRQNENSTVFDDPDLALMPDGTGAQGPMIYVQGEGVR